MLKTSCAKSSSIVLFSRSEWHSHKVKWVHRKEREGGGQFSNYWHPRYVEHFSRHPATFWEELSGLCIWPSGLLSSCKEGVVKSPKQRRAWANSVPAYFYLTHEIPTKPLSPGVCVCGGGGGGTPFNVGWGCAAECVGTWPSSIIKGHKPCSRQKCENRCPVPTCSGTQAGTATLFFAARCWSEKSNPDPGRVPKSEWAKSTTCSWQKRWFLDPIPDSERQKPYPVERHIPV